MLPHQGGFRICAGRSKSRSVLGIIRTQDSGKIWKLSFQQGDLPFSIRFHKGFRFISTLKAGCFRDLSTGIPLCFSILEHTQGLGLLSGSVEILSFDLDVRHSVSRLPLLLLPRLLFFASTHLGSPMGQLVAALMLS